MNPLLQAKYKERDELIRKVWLVMRDISDIDDQHMSNEDLDIWDTVTRHTAIQSRLDKNKDET